ncbi:DUF308 domain-containing protein [Actinoplanes xinjiangensis]|uniref:DUF4190 domain-containing protein n=1 Tax=Actinoplanes xinjiangensis TaxID=512350 RepID=A0A316FP75_9ACTN|nr:DUF308 domain-containing protein [Actinoplanes xinjiangensis]PWK50554.1 hypothetical protein BC793_103440 [Actinoplanes xinjiangensis]GIF36443.1 hypothetical protein Axi01nite_07540 [Actinoplanes xinjiangensis]
MRLPTFPRQTTVDDANTERTPVTPRHDEPTTATLAPVRSDTVAPPPARPQTFPPRTGTSLSGTSPSETERARAVSEPVTVPVTTPAPRARASLVATLGLVLAVAGALLVLSGPLLGYGVGVSAVALVLSLAGIFATRKRHVAGKTGALIGVVLSLAAVVIGVLALAGQLWWLGTDTQTVTELRTWLDTQFETRI